MTTTTGDHLALTVEEAAERVKVGRPMMYALVKSRAIESICIGRLRRIPWDAQAYRRPPASAGEPNVLLWRRAT